MKSIRISFFKSRALRSALMSAFALGAVALAGNANAASAGSDLQVTAIVSANCSISAGTVDFGAYDPVSANASSAKTGTGTVTVNCTSGSGAVVTLAQGANPVEGSSTDAAPQRRMKSAAGNYLRYALYQDTNATPTVWGNTAGTGVSHTGIGSAVDLTVYGSIAGAQNVPAGTYTDTVTATVTF